MFFYRVIKDGSGDVKIVPQADNPYTQATGMHMSYFSFILLYGFDMICLRDQSLRRVYI